MKQSKLELTFLNAWNLAGNGSLPTEEFRFHDVRKWRFDFAWPEYKIAVESVSPPTCEAVDLFALRRRASRI